MNSIFATMPFKGQDLTGLFLASYFFLRILSLVFFHFRNICFSCHQTFQNWRKIITKTFKILITLTAIKGCKDFIQNFPENWPSKAELRQCLTSDFAALTAWWQILQMQIALLSWNVYISYLFDYVFVFI